MSLAPPPEHQLRPAPHRAALVRWRTESALRLGYDRLAVALFFAAFALALATFGDYGITWDEDYHFWYGFHVVSYYTSFFQDTTALTSPPISYYGAAFDATAALLSQISPLGGYETRHLLNALVGITGIIGVWRLARFLAGPRAGFWAALLLLLAPSYYGHMFNNPKDIPFASAYIWALYYIIRLVPLWPNAPKREALKLALAIGLALGVRVGGLLLFCYLGLAAVLLLTQRAVAARSASRAIGEAAVALRWLVPVALLAYAVMLLCWPWAQLDPLRGPIAALMDFSHHPFPYPILFDGQYYHAATLPYLYLPVHLLIKLPELMLLLAAAALGLGLWRLRWRVEFAPALQHGLLAFAALFPVAYAVAIHATLFDGMRHFLFVVPPLACLAGIAFDRIAAPLEGRALLQAGAAAALALYLGHDFSAMVALHPDEYVYFNSLVGGTAGAAGRFKLDYWANSYREAVLDLTAWLQAREGARFAHKTYRVAACGPPGSVTYFLPENLVYVAERKTADFYIAFTKDDCDKSIAGRPILRIEREGALLSVVLDLRRGETDQGLSQPRAISPAS